MNKRDLDSIDYVVSGLLHDLGTNTQWADGYHSGIRDLQRAVQLLVAGHGMTLDNIVRQSRKRQARRQSGYGLNATNE